MCGFKSTERAPTLTAARLRTPNAAGVAIASSYAFITSAATCGHANRSTSTAAARAIRARRTGSSKRSRSDSASSWASPTATSTPSTPSRTTSR